MWQLCQSVNHASIADLALRLCEWFITLCRFSFRSYSDVTKDVPRVFSWACCCPIWDLRTKSHVLVVLLILVNALKSILASHISTRCVSPWFRVMVAIVLWSTVIALDSKHRDLLSLLCKAVLYSLNLPDCLSLSSKQCGKCFCLSVFV